MASVFTKITNREIPAKIIDEDEDYIAFLDVMPLAEGHTLVIPKKETDLIFDLSPESFSGLWLFAQKIAKKLGSAYPDKRVTVAVVGLEVPHAHIHLVPVSGVEELNFKNSRLHFSDEEMEAIADKIINS